MITGFRHALGGYQSICGVTPDLTTMGKAMGNGWPVSALAGKAELMELFSTTPGRPAFFAGTFNGHPPTAAAALATIDKLQREPVHEHVFRLGERTRTGLRELYARLGVPVHVSGFGSVFVTYFLEGTPTSYDDLLANDVDLFVGYRRELMKPRDLRAAAEPQAQPLLVRAHRRRRRPPARGDRGGREDGAGEPGDAPPAVTSTIDLEAPGKQIGRLQYPKISNTAGWAYEFVPIASFANGEGPTVRGLRRQPRRRVRGADRAACGWSTSCSSSRSTAG